MAPSFNRLGFALLRHSHRIQCRRKQRLGLVAYRPLHSTRIYRTPPDDVDDARRPNAPKNLSSSSHGGLDPQARQQYDLLSPEERVQYQKEEQAAQEHLNSPAMESEMQGLVSQAVYDINKETPRGRQPPERITPGLMAMGEVDEQGSGEDDEFDGDDITSIAHGELEQHREIRDYARISAWEMPMLSKLAKPFVLPSAKKPLRFRYTTYMGETHPAANKVVLEFCTRDLPKLTEAQRIKLVKLVGVRYNPEKDLVKMSCEMFETQAQNKRYLGDLVDTLVAEARDPTDMFEDVPLDFRHHKPKPRFEFPEKWKLTKQRKEQLAANWRQGALKDQEREEAGQLIDGSKVIEQVLEAISMQAPAQPTVLPRLGKGRQRQLVR
ncbi:MAG: hypothetical protein Q9208_001802 [Pyrenodesmia sp. 3 TL-2023]